MVMDTRIRCGLSVVMLVMLAVPARAQDTQDWQRIVAALSTGTRLELQLEDGTRVQGTLLLGEADTLVLSPRTRIPVAPWRIAYSEIRSIDVKRDGALSPGSKVLIGIGAGAGVAFLTLLILVATIAD
jgi:hypothetical protein